MTPMPNRRNLRSIPRTPRPKKHAANETAPNSLLSQGLTMASRGIPADNGSILFHPGARRRPPLRRLEGQTRLGVHLAEFGLSAANYSIIVPMRRCHAFFSDQ